MRWLPGLANPKYPGRIYTEGAIMADTDPQPTNRSWFKWVLLGLVASVIGVWYTQFGDALSLEGIAERESSIRDFQATNPLVVFSVGFAIYVAVTGLSIPGATVLTVVFGWYFGFVPGLIIVSFASTTGATLAFLLSRYILRSSIQRWFGERLRAFNAALEQDGTFYLFTLRLVPAVPFFVINLVMGLTPLRVLPYWWVSQIGMLPGTAVYVYAGATVPDLQALNDRSIGDILSPQLIVAFALLGLFPLVAKLILKRFQSGRGSSSPPSSSESESVV